MAPISSSRTTPKRIVHWPRNSDFKVINRAEAKALVSEFGTLYGLDVLRSCGNFKHMTISTVDHFDNVDLLTAIQFMIGHQSCDVPAQSDAGHKRHLLQRLEAACGPLDKPIALCVVCSRRTFAPAHA